MEYNRVRFGERRVYHHHHSTCVVLYHDYFSSTLSSSNATFSYTQYYWKDNEAN